MKKIKIFSLFSFLIILLIYVTNITAIPASVILLDGEELKLDTVLGVKINKKDSIKLQQASTTFGKKVNELKQVDYQLSLLDKIPLKTIEANIIPQTTVIPIGKTIGLKLYTDGVLVVGMSEIENINNEKVKPYENSKIKEGDRIIAIDEEAISCTSDLVNIVNNSKGKNISLKYVRENKVFTSDILPVQTSSKEYKLGLWVRDAQARSWYNFLL